MKILTDTEIYRMAREKYPIQNPNCHSERFIKERMRMDFIRRMKAERDEQKKASENV